MNVGMAAAADLEEPACSNLDVCGSYVDVTRIVAYELSFDG